MEQTNLFDDSVVVIEEQEVTQKPKLVALDPKQFDIDLNVGSEKKPKIVSALFGAPEHEDDFAYAAKAKTRVLDAGDNEDEIIVDDLEAGVEMFDKYIKMVKGFVLPHEDRALGKDWRDAQSIKHAIPQTWKASFVRGMRVAGATLVDNEDFVVLGAEGTMEVDFWIGYEDSPVGKCKFYIPDPSTTELSNWNAETLRYLQGRGKKRSFRNPTNLRFCADFFDTLMERSTAMVEGATVGGVEFNPSSPLINRKAWLLGINPVYKAKIITAAMTKYNARLQD